MERFRDRSPPLQVAEQAPHAAQSAQVQKCFSPQGSVWHGATSKLLSVVHAFPLFFAGVLTERIRSCVPPPQVFEQPPHSLHSSQTQSTSDSWRGWQNSLWQALSSFNSPWQPSPA